MSHDWIWKWKSILLLACLPLVYCSGGHFNGGSVSYSITKNQSTHKLKVNLDVITGWELGKGPCGTGCNKNSIGTSTLAERRAHAANYFGDWKGEVKIKSQHGYKDNDLTAIILQHMAEKVIAVSEKAKWEQEWMKVTLDLPDNLVYEDITYDGSSWHNLSIQGSGLQWHIQAKILPGDRSDTGTPNNSPKALVKPYYRIKLDEKSTIRIATSDPDGDFVKCEESKDIEAGALLKVPLKGLIVNKECTVTINATLSNGYHDGNWVAITLMIRDYNRKQIQFGGQPYNPVSFSLSGTSVQFLVQILDNLREPEFIEPTLDSNHEIIIYAGATWTTDVYAMAATNTTIEEFVVTVRGDEHFVISDMHDDTTRTLVKYIHLSWAPTASDIGHHITCVRAVDNTGIDTASDRCFLIEVKDQTFHHMAPPPVPANKPIFIDLPTLTQTVSCKLDTTCIFPVFVLASAAISKIEITQNFFDESFIGDIVKAQHATLQVYKTDVSIVHSLDGSHTLCLVATDINGVKSDETCLTSDIDPADPCLSSPCQNSAVCTLDPTDPGVYTCQCTLPGSYGTHCEKRHKGCDSSPCEHNGNCVNIPPQGFWCTCGSDYSGLTCNIVKNKCNPDPCNGHGICKDDGHTQTCSCFGRYDGADCSHDLCPSKSAGIITCELVPSGCTPDPCNGHGVCRDGALCTCSLGYRTAKPYCDMNIGDIFAKASHISFKPPTPTKGSTMTCFYTSATPEPCKITVYFASSDSVVPTVDITDASADLIASSTVNPTDNVTYIPGIEKMYTTDIVIVGSPETKGKKFICITVKDSKSEDKRCIELMFVFSPLENPTSPEVLQKNANCKFLEPTPLVDTKFVCNVGRTCSFMMFTTYDAGCKHVITADKSVTVFEPIPDHTLYCVTEVTYKFSSPGLKHICFQSAITDFQTRCVYIDVFPNGQDPCRYSPCQNDGICFFEKGTPNAHNCVCKEGFTGPNCEKGQCLPADNNCVRGYCVINNCVTTCLCPLGYSGPTCSHEIPTDSPDPEKNGATFTDTAKPTAVTCIKNRPCSIPFVVSGKFPTTATTVVSPGYVSPSVVVNGIATVKNSQPPGSYQSNVQITAEKEGMQDVCLQTVSKDGINMDEMCFKLDITTDTSSVYGFKNRAHFTTPSLPPDSNVTCSPAGACHVLYHVTPGEGNGGKCTDVQFSAMPFENSHIFSSCDTCVTGNVGNNNCSIDVTLFPTAAEVGTESTVCVLAKLVSNNERGEERCFKVAVKSETEFKAKGGCQKIHCKNGGFCDGHTDPAVCFCKRGFSGSTCENVDTASTSSATSSQTLVGGDIGIPKEVKCILNQPCPIPFQVTGKPNTTPTITTGYTDPSFIVGTPVVVDVKQPTDKTTDYTGIVNVSPMTSGKHVVCVQTTENSLVADEMCITIDVGAGPLSPADQNKPYFLDPTYRSDSTILCKENQYCHIEMHYTKGDLFGASGKCPSLSDTSPNTVAGLFIFATEINTLDCSNDVTYASPSISPGGNSTHRLCFRIGLPGKNGEERCFNIKVVSDISSEVISPCSGSECGNGGKCIADLTSSPPAAACVCSQGFEGSDCKTAIDKSKDLDGVKDPPVATSNTPHFNGDSSIPKEITCVVNTPCALPVMYHGDITHPPTLGYVDPGLSTTTKPVTTLSTPGSTPASHALTTLVTATTTGDHLLCLQTNADGLKGGVNIDEICMHVQVNGPPAHSATISPTEHFHSDNLPDNSTVTCSTNSVCHVPITTNKLPTGKCPNIRECGQGIPGVHVFQTSLVNGKCTTDVAYKTDTVQQTNTLCVSASPDNEELHYQVETTDRTDFGPCQKLHCQNGGICNAKTNACECKSPFSGATCDQVNCGAPPPPGQHSSFVKKNGTTLGSKATYKCDMKYISMLISVIITCGSNGVWTTPPDCFLIDCGSAPATGVNAILKTQSGREQGETAIYACTSGYENIPGKSLTINCLQAGYWDTAPECRLKDCGILPNRAHVSCVAASSTTFGSTATCTCETGYGSTGNMDIACLADGSWGTPPTCIIDVCSNLHCENGGYCVASSGKPVCLCKPGWAGTTCGKNKVDLTSAIPDSIACVQGQPCFISFPVPGINGGPPAVVSNSTALTTLHKDTTASPPVYHATLPVSSSYNSTVCFDISSLTSSKSCVHVSHLPPQHPTPSPGEFMSTKSSYECNTNTPCFISVSTLPNSDGSCPQLSTHQDTTLEYVHVFDETQTVQGHCVTSVTVAPSTSNTGDQQLCLLTPNSLKKCIKVHVRDSPDPDCGNTLPNVAHVSCTATSGTTVGSTATCTCNTGYVSAVNMDIACLADGSWATPPGCTIDICQTLHCENGGFCVASSGKPVCLCKPGLSGTTCGTNKVAITSFIPDTIECVQGQPCVISFPVPGINGRTPSVISNGSSTTTLDKDNTANPPVYHATVPVTSTQDSTVCFDIGAFTGSQTTEKSCVHVSHLPSGPTTPSPGDITTTTKSYNCKPDIPCFLSVTTKPQSNGSCPQLSTHQDTTLEYVHVFDERQMVQGHCVTSVTVAPSTSNTGDQKLCLTASSSSKKCIKVHVGDIPNQDICKTLHCKNGGYCVASSGKPVCLCKPGLTGKTCGTNKVDITSVIPDSIECVQGQPCVISFPVPGINGRKPSVVSNGTGTTTLDKDNTANPPVYHATVPVTSINNSTVCFNIGALTGSQSTEKSCVHVSHLPSGPPTPSPGDITTTTSSYHCKPDVPCFLSVTTKPQTDGTCPQISNHQDTTLEYVHVFDETQSVQGHCVTSVTVTPSTSNTGDQQLCLTSSSSKKCIKVLVSDIPDQDVCKTLHCENGGYCVASNGKPVCLCKPGLTGTTCGTNKVDTTSAIPDSITCVQGQPCFISFPVPGINGRKPTIMSNGTARTTLDKDVTANPPVYHATLPVSSSLNSTVCFNISSLTGSQPTESCVHVSRLPARYPTPPPGDFTTTNPSYKCKPDVPCFLSVSTIPYSNGSCPQLSTHQDTTLGYVHVFDEPQVAQGHCVTSITVKPSSSNTGNQQLCLASSSSKNCIKVHVGEECDVQAASVKARQRVSEGFASCYCVVNDKRIQIIRKRPVVKTETLVKNAGYGAAGMSGGMLIAVGVYFFTTKRKPSQEPHVRRKPEQRRPRTTQSGVNPDVNNLVF